jgi:hypothetical protein
MIFDVTNFAYGAGLVMLPYIVGMIIGMVWNTIHSIKGM